ncbi:MAG: DUF4097 family beta strand repeat protein [Spirochaetes bacterium]|nr:DUF4097 family beta strand repeat protein [Spirochaetota bacterium]
MTRKTYIEELAQELSILPSEERQDIILEFDSHIDELMSRQPELPEEDLIARLPAPATFAGEFLAADASGKYREQAETFSSKRASESGTRFSSFRRFFRYARGEQQQLDWQFSDVTQIEVVAASADIQIQAAETCSCHIVGYWDDDEPSWEQTGTLVRMNLGADADLLTLALPPALCVLVIKTASGDIRGALVPNADISINTASGDVQVELNHGIARVMTASGDVSLDGVITDADIKTASGDVTLDGLQSSLRIASASGDIRVNYTAGAANGSIASMSGDVSLSLPSGSQPAVEASTVSGDISALNASVRKQPGRKYCSCPGGPGELKIKTMSGDIRIQN